MGDAKDVISPVVTDDPIVKEKQSTSVDTSIPILENTCLRSCPPLPMQGSTPAGNTSEDVGTVLVWVKLHGVPITTFSDDGLSVIATKLGNPLMLDSYTSDMCLQSWGRCNVCVEYEWKHLRCACCKFFGHIGEECPKNPGSRGRRGVKEKDKVGDAKDVVSTAVTHEPVGSTPANTPGMSSYANVTFEPSRKALNFHTLFTPRGNEIDVVVSVESIRAISESYMDGHGLNAMLENGLWFIRNYPLILKKWNPKVNLLKENVGTVSVWVKLHGVLVMAFSGDGLSAISMKLCTPLMLTLILLICACNPGGRSSYTKVMIELQADLELKDTIMEECPKNLCFRVVKNLKKPSHASRGVSHNKKKGVEPTKEDSNSNLFVVLNLVDNDGELGNNGETSNLASNRANSSGSSFWNVETSSTSTTLFLLEQWRDSYENDDYDEDPYDDDMYEGQDLPDKIQDICDNLNIRVRGRKKK
ncbi:retrotransposon protein, putative, ty1-copia subclass [Tanacetum coccineum]